MTKEEAITKYIVPAINRTWNEKICKKILEALEQEPCEDAISRQAVIDVIKRWLECSDYNEAERHVMRAIQSVLYDSPSVKLQEPKTGHCEDCKWWKDSDGMFRRGIDAESQCPMNRIEVYEGTGYCFMFEHRESEDKE